MKCKCGRQVRIMVDDEPYCSPEHAPLPIQQWTSVATVFHHHPETEEQFQLSLACHRELRRRIPHEQIRDY